MTEELRVDTDLVSAAGGRIKGLAEAIPAPPEVSPPVGEDALTAAISERITEVVDPVIEALPVTKEELKQFAQNVVSAADEYDAKDRQIAEEILKQIGAFDEPPAHGGAVPSGGSSAVTGPSSPLSAAGASVGGMTGASVGGAAGQAGGFEQMMGMPMQMAQQAAQMPMQMAGMAGQVPQQLAQGVQGAMEQVSQVSGLTDGGQQGLGDDQSAEAVDGVISGQAPAEPESQMPAANAEQQVQGDQRGERTPVESPSARSAVSDREIVL
ncbi:hypothetical protein ABQE48_04685 [Mycolicibacterium thermoresistibile]